MNNRPTIFNGTKVRIKSKLNMDCCLLDKLDFVDVSLINSRELFARAWFCFAVNFWNRLTSSVISRPTCFSSSLRCCWQVGSPPFVRRRCDCLASSAPFANIQTYLPTSSQTRNVLSPALASVGIDYKLAKKIHFLLICLTLLSSEDAQMSADCNSFLPKF